MNISMSNNIVPQQQGIEPADVQRERSPEPVVEISSAGSVQDDKSLRETEVPSDTRDKPEVDGETLNAAVVELNKAVQNMQRNLEFSVDEVTGRNIVKVKDRETDEVIRQMPSEDALKLAQHVHQQQAESGGNGFSLMQELKA